MNKTAFLVSIYGQQKGVIIAETKERLLAKMPQVIRIELEAEEVISVDVVGEMGDWGEDTVIMAKYINGGQLIENDDIVVTKKIIY